MAGECARARRRAGRRGRPVLARGPAPRTGGAGRGAWRLRALFPGGPAGVVKLAGLIRAAGPGLRKTRQSGLHLASAMLQQREVAAVPERRYRRERRETPDRLHAGGCAAVISEDALRQMSREDRAALSRSLAALNDGLPSLRASDERRRQFVVLVTGASGGLIPWIRLLAI